MRSVLPLLMATPVMAAPPAHASCMAVLPMTAHTPQPTGPRCLTAATATALSAQPDAPTESAFARSVRITTDGIDPFDLQQAMERPRSAVSASSLESR